MNLIPALPLSLWELVEYYRIAVRECEFLLDHLYGFREVLEVRMKPSPLVSVRFNKYESYYVSFLEHLKWRLSDICIDPSLEFKDSGSIEVLLDHTYTYSGIAHPIGESEIEPMLESLDFVRDRLNSLEGVMHLMNFA